MGFRSRGPRRAKRDGVEARAAKLSYLVLLVAVGVGFAQDQKPPSDQPEVRMNYLNVCNPPESDQQEIRTALAHIPAPQFAPDFEVSRGRTTVPDSPIANYVRLRHEFPASIPFVAAQYSLSVDEKSIVEDLVFRSREPKDVIQIQLEDTVTGAEDARAVLATDTPVNRIKLERFGKASVALARCPTADQSAYEPLFQQASEVMRKYRAALKTKQLIPRELTVLGALPAPKRPGNPSDKRP
jgi:hypothetical protein